MSLLKIRPYLINSGSFTGSFSGTGSYARRALTASYVLGGAAGSSGTSGANGSSGTSGNSGTSGTSATAGSSGTSGVGSPGTSGTAGSSGTSSTATVQTGSIAKQTLWTNVTSGSTNTITGLSLSSNKWDVSVVEEWDAATLDQYYNSSSLLCHFDSLNPAGRFIDSSRNNFTITSNGDSRLSTSQYKFGGASAYFDGTADNLLINYNNAFNLSGDFTIEVWFYPITLNGGMILNFAGGLNIAWASYELVNNTDGINFAGSSANNGYDIGSETGATGRIGTVSVNTWNHIAVTRQGNVYRGYINGVQGYTQTLALTPYNPNARGLAIGSNYATTWGVTPATVLNGYLDELRITKGVARYTANFTPSNAPFPNSRNQVLTKYVGLVGGIDDKYVDYGVQKLSDSSLKLTRLTYPNQPIVGSGSLSGSVNRVYVNVLDYTKVSVTSSYSLLSKTASYALNASGGGGSTLRTGSLYPITASWSRRAITASYALNGGTALVNQTLNYVSGSNLYTLSRSVVSPSDVLLSVNGIIQTPITDYTVSASKVTFTESYPSGSKINARYLVTATNSSDVNLANIVLTGTTTGDAYYPQVAALLHFDGVNGSTTITDNSKNNLTVTSVNGTAISTAQSKFGGASVLFDGTNDYLSIASNSVFDLLGDYTIEFWAYSSNFAAGNMGYLHRGFYTTGTATWSGLSFSIRGLSTLIRFYFYATTSANEQKIDVSLPSNNAWHHFAMVKSGTTGTVYVDGTLAGTITSLNTPAASSQTLRIGVWDYSAASEYFNGYIDELRITNGYARYTGNFTPSTTAFSNTGGDVGKSLVVNSTATGVSIGTAGFNLNSSNINRIINGAMAVDQRNAGAAQTITAAAALAYTVDRWYAYCTGANVTGQRITGSANNQFAYRFTGAASVTAIGFGQRIEAANSIDLAGSTATLGVDLANSVLTSVTWTAYYANTSDTFGTLASPTRTQISTGTFTVTSTLTRYSAQIFIPSAAITGLEIVFSVGAQTSGTWTIDNVQLEAGPLATPFERRMIGQELILCQRYFASINGAIGAGSELNTSAAYIKLPLSVTMRADNQTVTLSTGNSISVDLFGTGTSTTSTSNVTITANRAGILFNINSLSPSQGATGVPATILGTVSVSSEL